MERLLSDMARQGLLQVKYHRVGGNNSNIVPAAILDDDCETDDEEEDHDMTGEDYAGDYGDY